MIGLPLDRALELFGPEESVTTIEVRSRKGSAGDDARVIKTEQTEAGTVVYWSRFRTTTE